MTATPTRQLRVYGNHSRSHWWPANAHEDCAGCAPWFEAASQASRDQALAARRDDEASGFRAVGTALLIATAFATGVPGALSFWSWISNLGAVTIHHFWWVPLLGVTALCIYALWRGRAR